MNNFFFFLRHFCIYSRQNVVILAGSFMAVCAMQLFTVIKLMNPRIYSYRCLVVRHQSLKNFFTINKYTKSDTQLYRISSRFQHFLSPYNDSFIGNNVKCILAVNLNATILLCQHPFAAHNNNRLFKCNWITTTS